jgi:hypothetical protein
MMSDKVVSYIIRVVLNYETKSKRNEPKRNEILRNEIY